MLPSFHTERDDSVVKGDAPYLSHSRVNRYLVCPEQYRFYYIEHLRPQIPSASLVFGSIMHQALAQLFQKKGDPIKHFIDTWAVLRELRMGFRERESWDKLKVSGEALLRKFIEEELPKIGNVRAVERAFTFSITTLDLPFVGILDLHADVEEKSTVIDFKTSGARYDDHEAELSDQLTAYQMAEPSVDQVALCVLVKTKEPKIEWHIGHRGGAQLNEYLGKAGYVAREIAAGAFYKRVGIWCSWCDFLPLCLGDKRRAEATLTTVQ